MHELRRWKVLCRSRKCMHELLCWLLQSLNRLFKLFTLSRRIVPYDNRSYGPCKLYQLRRGNLLWLGRLHVHKLRSGHLPSEHRIGELRELCGGLLSTRRDGRFELHRLRSWDVELVGGGVIAISLY